MIKVILLILFALQLKSSQKLNEFWELSSLTEFNSNFNINFDGNYKSFKNQIYQIGIFNNEIILNTDKKDISISELIPNYESSEVITFEIDDEFIAIKDFNYIYLLGHNNLTQIKFKYQIPCKLYLSNLEIWNNNLYLFDVKFSENNCKETSQTILIELNLINKELKKVNFDNIEGIDMAVYGTRKLIDFNNGILSISDITNYKVRFYNVEKGIFVDSIFRNDYKPWGIEQENYPKYNCDKYISNYIYKAFEFRKILNQIWRSEFINDSTYLVSWTYPSKIDGIDSYRCKYDLYKKQNNKWAIYEMDLLNYEKNPNDIFSPENISLYQTFRIIDGNLFKVVPYPKKLIDFSKLTTISEFDNKVEEYYLDNDLEYTFLKFKFK